MKENEFVISVNGLAMGESCFVSHAGKEFFAKFENYEVLDADLRVSLVADHQQDMVDVDCNVTGTLTVPCDRCLCPVAVEISTGACFRLRLKETAPMPEDDSYEEVFLQEGSDQLDLCQEIYDYSLLALPLQRFHKEGECDAAALACLSEGEMEDAAEATDSPFAALADLMNNK